MVYNKYIVICTNMGSSRMGCQAGECREDCRMQCGEDDCREGCSDRV